jgi:hypothetical protein
LLASADSGGRQLDDYIPVPHDTMEMHIVVAMEILDRKVGISFESPEIKHPAKRVKTSAWINKLLHFSTGKEAHGKTNKNLPF